MKTFQFRKDIWLWAIMLLPVAVFIALGNRLPEKIPSHFDIHGHPNQYMAPGAFIAIMFGASLLVYLVLLLVPRIDPRKANYSLFAKTYFIFRVTIQIVLTAISCLVLMIALGKAVNVNRIVFLLILLLFIVLGNYMGNVRPNWFVGIRTPWTLSSERVWRKTHQLAGKMMFFAGIAGFLLCLFLPDDILIWVFLSLILGSTLFPAGYSYFLYRNQEQSTEKTNPS